MINEVRDARGCGWGRGRTGSHARVDEKDDIHHRNTNGRIAYNAAATDTGHSFHIAPRPLFDSPGNGDPPIFQARIRPDPRVLTLFLPDTRGYPGV